MKPIPIRHILLSLLAASALSSAKEFTFRSGPGQTHLVELFTSEGCSSCPPAESRLSALRQSPRLWKEIVPVAFHVDYWDSLGWPDRFSSPAATRRQRTYAASWRNDSIYTPEFVLNGKEWRGRNLDDIAGPGAAGGTLTATLKENGEVGIAFQPPAGASGRWQANAALLSLGISVDVTKGENAGRTLLHDFVVISHATGTMAERGEAISSVLKLPAEKMDHGRTALAVWITPAGRIAPVQAAGGAL